MKPPIRILLLLAATASIVGVGKLDAQTQPAPRPGWRMIFNNDTTNILSCTSPYNKKGLDGFSDDMVRATVDEAAVPGVDAMAIMPGCGWIPWWPSKIYPMAEHEAWFNAHYGIKGHFIIDDYILAGGDYIKVFVDECHRKGVAALISYRVNDVHVLEPAGGKVIPINVETVSRFYIEHPELRLEPHASHYGVGTHNWLKPAAPAYKLSLITELLENYDLEGIELDFLRFSHFFPDGTPMPERVAVMTHFVGQVRAVLDRTERHGKRRWLGVRVSQNAAEWKDTGFDAAAYRAAGVDYFNLSPSFTSSQQNSIAEVRRAVPDATLYFEETNSPQNSGFNSGYHGTAYRRNTDEMLKSTARLGYHRGADGISVFNFVYYRPYLADKDQEVDEPPFDVLPILTNRAALEKSPGYFYLSAKDQAFHSGDKTPADGTPLSENEATYSMDLMPSAGNPEGRLRLQVLTEAEHRASGGAYEAYFNPSGTKSEAESHAADGQPGEKISRGRWRVMLNGHELTPATDPLGAYPFPTRYRVGFGKAEQYLSWRIPPGMTEDGVNQVKVTYLDGPPSLRLRWIEVFSYSP